MSWDHPRIRGEHDVYDIVTARGRGSSPHTRGARHECELPDHHFRIIPAYAGSTDPPHAPSAPSADHPRIRGEHIRAKAYDPNRSGSSPHTRGALASAAAEAGPERIIPAYAGSTLSLPYTLTVEADHPRIRGEHKAVHISVNTFEGSSPHTRGARGAAGHHPADPRIIPAYAGSTSARELTGRIA